LKRLKELGARGCVVLGDPVYYRRFGFQRDIGLRFANVPSEYFQRLVINGEPPQGVVNYHPASPRADGRLWHHPEVRA
jgi:putative acetyltransferase